jgi:hypothetical protein
MKRSIFWGFFFSILGSLVFIQTGCDFFKNSPSGPSIVNSLANSSAAASVRFELVVPHKGDGTPLASIRGASKTSVTFRLVLARPGDTTRTKDILTKSVAVSDDGSATVTFNNIPERPCVGQLSINNGNYQGYTDFHGALDLKKGENTIELAPAGSKLPQDILAHTAIAAFDSTEIMQAANNTIIQAISNSIRGIDATKNDVYTASVNKAIEVLRPSTVTYFAISNDKKSLMGYSNGVKNWEKSTSDYFQPFDFSVTNISDMYIKEIIRQNLSGVGYVAWKHSTLSPFAIGAITSSGSLQAFVKNPGVCEQILALSDGSVVIGGANDDKSCPVLFRWSGTKIGSTWSNSAGVESGLIWCHYFTEQTYSGSGDKPTVKGLQFDGVDGLIVTVDNVEDNSLRTYRISLSSGSVLDRQTEKPNEFPSIVLQSPENGATFSVSDEIVFEAVASDTDGAIAKVEFYAGNSKVGEATSKPYSCSTTSLLAGTHILSAIVIDDKGAKTKAISIEITVIASTGETSEFAGGTGVEGDPFLVENARQLDLVRKYPKSFFKQIADIDLSDFLSGNEIGWVPIGESYIGDSEFVGAFQGTYDGNYKKITNLRIDLPNSGFVGLFGFVCQSTVKNLTIESAQIKGKISDDAIDNTMIFSHEGIGILIGGAGNGIEVNNCHVSGSVYGAIAGALIGRCSTKEASVNISVQNSTSNATVNGPSNSVVGGLIGILTGSVFRCSSSGIINGGNAGGLIGTASNGMVTQTAGSTVVSESFSDADVTGSNWAGGLIGALDYCSLTSSYAKGKVVGGSAGGLVGSSGFNSSNISSCYSAGSVEGSMNTGGLVGDNSGPISYSYSSSTVNTTGDYSGGLVGCNSGTISDSYSTGSVSGNNYVGGFCGRSYPSGYLFRCHSIGIVSGGVNQPNIGGFCGKIFEDWQIVYDCFWDIEKSGMGYSNGGLGLTTENMKKQASFVNWDFDIIWQIKDTAEHPILR